MTSPKKPPAEPPPLFQPPDIGLEHETWDDMPKAVAPRCEVCDRPLRSEKSKTALVGPGCAAKVGRAVIASRTRQTLRRTT